MPEPTTPTTPTPAPVGVAGSQQTTIATKVSAPVTGTDTVVIALKYPPGLILRYEEQVDDSVATPFGYEKQKTWRPTGDPFVVRGNAATVELQLSGLIPNYGGYAFTHGIPADLWEHWRHSNARHPLVLNELIEAFKTEAEAVTWSAARSGNRSGLERIDPAHPELTVGSTLRAPNISGIQPGTRSA